MKFILPTNYAPNKEISIGKIKIAPYKRVVNNGFFHDSIKVDLLENDLEFMNEWVIFHTFLFRDNILLDWYECGDFNKDGLIVNGECCRKIDYSNISKAIYFPNTYPSPLNYENLYYKHIDQLKENKFLIINYFNSFNTIKIYNHTKQIRNNTFWRILILFSIIESIIGEVKKCSKKLICPDHGESFPHNIMSQKDWIKKRLTEIINNEQVNEYFDVIWKVRQEIRHKTFHKGYISQAHHIKQHEKEIVYDWCRTSEEWELNTDALSSLEGRIEEITKYLLLNKVFNFNMFPSLLVLKSIRLA